MQIDNIIWLPNIVDKVAWKHNVVPQEIEEVLFAHPLYRKVQRGRLPGEDLYAALGQTATGRYLFVLFVYKPVTREALLISARDMSKKERRQYGRK